MVWNTTQSAFYEAINAFNNGEKISENQSEKCSGETGTDEPIKSPPKMPENNGNNLECPQNRCPNCPACQKSAASPLSNLLSDKDMILIAGLILLLSRQNADRKLILALAFVLLT